MGWELILNLPSNDIPEPSTGVLAAAALAPCWLLPEQALRSGCS